MVHESCPDNFARTLPLERRAYLLNNPLCLCGCGSRRDALVDPPARLSNKLSLAAHRPLQVERFVKKLLSHGSVASDSSEMGENDSMRYECVMFTLARNIAETEQYFVVESSIARSTSFGLMSLPYKTNST